MKSVKPGNFERVKAVEEMRERAAKSARASQMSVLDRHSDTSSMRSGISRMTMSTNPYGLKKKTGKKEKDEYDIEIISRAGKGED